MDSKERYQSCQGCVYYKTLLVSKVTYWEKCLRYKKWLWELERTRIFQYPCRYFKEDIEKKLIDKGW